LAGWTQLDVPEGIRLASIALAAYPDPGGALDCLPENAALGAFSFTRQFDDALAVARRALPRLRAGTDPWNLALILSNVTMILGLGEIATIGSDEYERAVDESIAVAYSTGNPTAIAYAYFATLAASATDPERTRVALEGVRAYASEVDNRWM